MTGLRLALVLALAGLGARGAGLAAAPPSDPVAEFSGLDEELWEDLLELEGDPELTAALWTDTDSNPPATTATAYSVPAAPVEPGATTVR